MRTRRAVLFQERFPPSDLALIRAPFHGETTPQQRAAIADWVTATVMRGVPVLEPDEGREPPPKITRRQRDVLHFLALGYERNEIALELGISPWTVKNYMRQAYRAYGAHTAAQAVARWLRFEGGP